MDAFGRIAMTLALTAFAGATLAGPTGPAARARASHDARAKGRAQDAVMMAFLHARIHHVFYVVKQNRTYDEVLGDLGIGRGDPSQELFPDTITPNHHALARQFVNLDAFQGGKSDPDLWDAALKARIGVRNWGFWGDPAHYSPSDAGALPLEREPWKRNLVVFFPTNAALAKVTDPYFRGFDQAFPDYWRMQEWKREFRGYVSAGKAPGLMLVRLPHDHFGEFGRGIDGVNSVETQMADNDYAVGLLVQAVAESPFAADTLIFVVEDRPSPSPLDARRSIALIAGPYVRQGAVVSKPYAAAGLLRTIGDVLGLKPISPDAARARPMTAVFSRSNAQWSYKAVVPSALRATKLPLPSPGADDPLPPPMHTAAYWSKAMAKQDFSAADRLDPITFNRALWRGMREDLPAASFASGKPPD